MRALRTSAGAATVVIAAIAAACTVADPDLVPVENLTGASSDGRAVVYAAVGASETAGVGTDDPFEDAWPRVLWRTFPPGSVLYDFGVGGSTAGQAIAEQVDAAVAVEPDVVTVWLNVNDLLGGVPPGRFARELRDIVHALRRDGSTTVLVANTPRLDTLPVYLACRSSRGIYVAPLGNAVLCPPDAPTVAPPLAAVRAAVDAYNRRIERIVRREGAVLVDLYALGDIPTEHPEFVSEDGFHPSTEGAVALAAAFEATLETAGV